MKYPDRLAKWRQLSPRARSVFGQLWECANANAIVPNGSGGFIAECYPSRMTLAKQDGCSVNTIDRALNELRAAGLVVSVNRSWAGKHNAYTLFVPSELVAQEQAEREEFN